ncbi:MAG: hypothetical protein ACREBC_37630 [Pyrinomonadaceae bacterium]
MFETPKYHTLAQSQRLPAAGEHDIRVVFAGTMDQKQIQDLLLAVRAEIVDGPSSIGVYTIRIGSDNGARPDILAVLERLRHHPSVLFAEPALPLPRANREADRDR